MGCWSDNFSGREMGDIVGQESRMLKKSVYISESFSFKCRSVLLLILFLFAGLTVVGQTPGLIIKPISGGGKTVLDPDGDGYVSAPTWGVQLGFQNDDVTESEIKYVPLVRPDPEGDLSSGGTGGFTDIVGTDLDGNNAVLTYLYNNNLYFRIRLSSYAPNSKAYSVLVDTDQKFGFTGPNADPNAMPGNAGFEFEIVLRTNFSIDVHKIDNLNKAGAAINTYSYDSYCQKSVALSRNGSDPDYFYDFYIPVPLEISSSAGVRYVVVSSMSPSTVIGDSNLSDVSGVEGTVGNLDQIFKQFVDTQTPTAPGQPVLTRSDCPTIDAVSTTATTIKGTTTEAAGTTITVSVYNGTTKIGSRAVTTSSSIWTINVSELNLSVPLASGFQVRATAKAPGEGTSNDNCDVETVSDCAGQTLSSGFVISAPNSSKGFRVLNNSGGPATITIYNSSFQQFNLTGIVNPQVNVANGATAIFECGTGNCFPLGTYYFTFQKVGECISPYIASCLNSISGASATPTITTTPITIATTSVSGSCASSASPGTYVELYVNGNFLTGKYVINSTSWTFSGLNLSSYACAALTVKSSDFVSGNNGGHKCPTESAPRIIQRKALAPLIYSTGCELTVPTSISGNSSEIGATVELFKTSGTINTLVGTTTVPSSGIWTVSSISPALVSGDIIRARVKTGGCLVESDFSDQIKISTQTNISGYTINITTPIEGQTSVSGTISGGSYPVTLNVYVDQVLVGSGINISSPGGSWTVTGLTSFDLALGSKVQVALTQGSRCESALSTVSATVQCLSPAEKTISTGISTVCANSNATIVVQMSESGVLYTPVTSDGTVAGYGGMGNGKDLTLTTYALTNNPTVLKVRASKFPLGSCDVVLNSSVSFNLTPSPTAPSASSPQVYCATGIPPTLADLLVALSENCSVIWFSMASGGYPLASTTQVVANTTYYAESVNNATGCRSNTRAAVLVQAGNPAAPTASPNQTFCAGTTVGSLVATLSGPGTIRWYTTPTIGSPLAAGSMLVSGSIYYAETLQNSCVSNTRTAVNVSVIPIPTITATIPASICGPGSVTLRATASAGTINWYDAETNGNLLGSGTSFTTPPISSTTTYYVEATANGCTSVRRSVVATVNQIPTITFTSIPACAADGETYSTSVAVSGGVVTSTAGTVVNTSGNIWNIEVSKETNIILTVMHNGCTRTLSVTAPDCGCEVVMPPVSGGDKEYCSGSVIPSLSATAVASGVTIDWYADATGGAPLLTDAFSYSPSASGTYYAESRNISSGCKSSMRTAITVAENPAPVISSMIASICSGVDFTISPVNGVDGTVPSGTTYSWSAPSGTGFTGGQPGSGATHIKGTLINNTGVAQTATYNVTPISGSCTGTAFTVTVTIPPTAAVTSVTGTTPMAIGAEATFTANSVILGEGTGIWSSSNPAVATVDALSGLVKAIAPGTSNITYTISGGCGGTVSAAMTVTVVPTVYLTPTTLTSLGESGILTFAVRLSTASSQPVTIPFSLGGTATNGNDYIITASPVTIPAGSINANISITITNDMVVEGDETVIVTLGSPAYAVLGEMSIFTATIKDNDFNPVDDADGDGIVNTVDADDDNDGIADSVEGSADSDGDGKANWFDLDSDNDGIYDLLEAGGTDADFDGKVDNFVDVNGNGFVDSYDTGCNGSSINGSGNQVVNFLYVSNENYAIDSDIGTFAALYNTTSYIIIPLQHTVPIGATISILLSCDGNNTTTTGTIEQSLNNRDYSNSETFSRFGRNGIIFNYTIAESDARYIRIKRTNSEAIRIYNLNYSFIICNGTIGKAIADYDSDNDGKKDRIEIDSDNDGCFDVKESGFTDVNSDGKLDGNGVSPFGTVTGNQDGYTIPANFYLTSAYDYREVNPAAVGGTVSGSTTICSGSGSGTLNLSGHNGVITHWQSSVYPFTTWTDISVKSTTYSAALLTETTHFRAVIATSACGSATSVPAIITVLPIPTATISGTVSVCQNGTSPAIVFTNPQELPVTITYNINELNQTTISVNANSTSNVNVPTSAVGVFNYNLVSIAYQGPSSCLNTISGTSTVTVMALPTAAAGPHMTVCYNAGGINITGESSAAYHDGILWSTSGTGTLENATSLTLATYTPSATEIANGEVTFTLTAYGNSPCGNAVSTKTLTIHPDGSWTGTVNRDWNNPANWACNQLPALTTNVTIARGLINYPIVTSTVPAGMARDITIENGASVTVTGGKIQIAGSISNSGTFKANEGTIEMIGSATQTIGSNVFDTNTLMKLIVNKTSEVTLEGELKITDVVSPVRGILNSGGHLTLLSTEAKTALIDGIGTGNVTGYVNMQRYLPRAFGYKYFSSPFKTATVAEFADEVNLTETFPTFYRYNENNSRDSSGVTVYYSGWTKHTSPGSPLVPLNGYAANMGMSTDPVTVTMSGLVNNGDLQTTLYNHNRKYTKGFNLVGNPYPSPIDWKATGWIKTNIDNAIYFFNAGDSSRYTGTYTSYVNGQSTGDGDNIIASMQGFFVHVTDGAYPVTGTLGVSNAVRVNNLNPVFKSAVIDSRPTLRLTAAFEIKKAIEDAAVVYFDPTASVQFDKEKDALKIENTDELVPNIYTLMDGRKLSINGLSEPSDSVLFLPVGITTARDGWINLRAENARVLPFLQVYLSDAETGRYHDLRYSPEARFLLQKGVHDNRFMLVFSKAPFTGEYPGGEKLFKLIRTENQVLVKVNLPVGSKGNLMVTNVLGQSILRKEVTGKETVVINQKSTSGVYVITLVSGKRTESGKILMRQDYE